MLLWLLLAATPTPIAFEPIATGVEYALVDDLHIVRIDTQKATLRVAMASQERVPNRTASEWAEKLGFSVAINAGMYAKDNLTNVGHMHAGAHVNQASYNDYQSVLGLRQGKAELFDLDAANAKERLKSYDTVIQNLRLIKAPGVNVWQSADRKWSEAAIAMDSKGRLLFLFLRTPMNMPAFNARVLALPLEITHAMHVEGGPPASLSIRTAKKRLDLVGGYETHFFENDSNTRAWPLPNVIGVVQ